MPLPIGCAWCGLPLNVEGFNHRACTAERERDFGCLPMWWYHQGRDADGIWGEVIRVHVAEVEQAAAEWANDAGLDEKERARYVSQVSIAAGDLGWEQMMGSRRPYTERRDLYEIVTAERQVIAEHRAPDGSAFRGVL